jgi:hypothetical protein
MWIQTAMPTGYFDLIDEGGGIEEDFMLKTSGIQVGTTGSFGADSTANIFLDGDTGNITAAIYYGDGSGLTNITGFQPPSATLTNLSGITTNEIVFTNNTAWFDANGAGAASALASTNHFGNSVAVTLTNGANQFTGIFRFSSNGAPTIIKGIDATNAYLIHTNQYGAITCNDRDFTVEVVTAASVSVNAALFAVTYSTPLTGYGIVPLFNLVTANSVGTPAPNSIAGVHVDYSTVSTNGFAFEVGNSTIFASATNDFHFFIFGQ